MLSKTWQSAALRDKWSVKLDLTMAIERVENAGEGLNLPSSTLLNFGDIELKEIVKPLYELLSAKDFVRYSALSSVPDLEPVDVTDLDSPILEARR